MQRLVLRSFQSPGDIVMMTAAVRDMHKAYPGRFVTDVRTSADDLWIGNPYVKPLTDTAPGTVSLEMRYPLIHRSNERPYHFLHGYVQYLEESLGLHIPVTAFRGDIHLLPEEKSLPQVAIEAGVPERFWLLVAGGKYDFTAKWWNPKSYQAIVDRFRDRICFVQCGEKGHWHPELNGVVRLVGKTSLRDLVRLVYFSRGVVCPVTLAMHLAAAVESPAAHPPLRPCVVIGGGREPDHWESYPGHQYLSTVGMLQCCANGGCWKSRCQTVGDGDVKDRRDVCESPVQVSENLNIPHCMEMITPDDVIRKIELFLQAESAFAAPLKTATLGLVRFPPQAIEKSKRRRRVLLRFRHGLGDAVQFTIVLKHLRQFQPDWDIDVEALHGKHSCYKGLCRNSFVTGGDAASRQRYDDVFELGWHECGESLRHTPSTKPARCLKEVFNVPSNGDEFRYSIEIGDRAKRLAQDYYREICTAREPASDRFPVVLIHYQGNTSGDRKNLPHEVIRRTCEAIRESGCVAVVLDWDDRSPLIDQKTVFNPGKDHPMWDQSGTGDAEILAALIEAASLMIGVDSGPLHVAGATSTPTIGVWTKNHPVHFYDLADNVLHLVPKHHAQFAAGAEALQYFLAKYRSRIYADILHELPSLVKSSLGGSVFDGDANARLLGKLKTKSYGRDYYEEHKEGGLDYLHFGEWQMRYGRWLVECLDWNSKRLLDVGCACGSTLCGLVRAGATGAGVDLNEHMIGLGRKEWPELASSLHVCDAVNLHPFADEGFDCIHSSQAAEHWRPELVPWILRELHRVSRKGAVMFCSLDTEDVAARQNRGIGRDDPTHVCIKPWSWWADALKNAGWSLCSDEFRRKLMTHPESYLRHYDWTWFVARKN
jgi:ADP-heptose:LPS heptosyltransferase/2-polyprenyl-3-methyl-5-hydroxy-6-metoxy-1,4-benzoquinol methylase